MPTMTETSERSLLDRARAGDEGAFRDLVERFTPRVYGLARSMVRSPSLAEDVAQEVFFKVYAKLETFQEHSAFSTWLYRVTVNTAQDHLKKMRHDRSVQVDAFERLHAEAPESDPVDSLDRRDLGAEVRRAMAELPEKFRTILVLRELQHLSYEEISVVLGCSKGTVESRLFRARARLKDRIERRMRS